MTLQETKGPDMNRRTEIFIETERLLLLTRKRLVHENLIACGR